MKKEYIISARSKQKVEKTLDLLNEYGVLILEDYLEASTLKQLLLEYDRILQTENDYISSLNYPQGIGKRIDFDRLPTDAFPTSRKVYSDKFMKQIADAYLGTPNFFNHEIYVARDEYEEHNALNELHYDKLSTLKFFLYLNDIDKSNGAFEAVPGSHKLAQEIMEHYRKRGKKISKLPNRKLPDSLGEAIPMEAKAGALIIFTTDTYHRAGRVEEGKFRKIMRGHSRTSPMPKYQPDLLSKQWFNESILNPSRYFYSLADLFEEKVESK